ncbi:hypothetical protein GF406_22515 [candidate division KSB1 bacterium]|nr:hypothetical protein [candidate division KSB1 bacterium]
MISQNFSHSKRVFWIFCLLSACFWLAPFCIRIFLVDFENSVPLPETTEPQGNNILFQIKQYLDAGKKFDAFGLIFWNNLQVCVLNMVGGAMLGIITMISLLQNGFFTADVMSNVYYSNISVNEIVQHTLPHSIELIGIWISGAIGFSFAKTMIDFMRGKSLPSKQFMKFIGYHFLIMLLIILTAAYIEVYISASI